MKKKIGLRFVIALGLAMCVLGGPACAEILSSKDYTADDILWKCVDLYNEDPEYGVAANACTDCFFRCADGSYTTNPAEFCFVGDKTFDTISLECSYSEPIFNTFTECDDAYNAGKMPEDKYDLCDMCFSTKDGVTTLDNSYTDDNGIRFKYFPQYPDVMTECYLDTNEYVKCKNGYYGQPDSNPDRDLYLIGCTQCPGADTNKTITSDTQYGKYTELTKCYIPGNIKQSDNSGTYVFTKNCYYSK